MTTPPAERRLHPWSWLFVLLQQLRQFLVPLVVLVFVGGRADDGYLLWPLVGVAALVVSAVWQYYTFRYRVDEDRLVVREGVFERQVRQIPFARIHNVALHQTLLHRVFGVAEVRLESVGGKEPEAQMRAADGRGRASSAHRTARRYAGGPARPADASPTAGPADGGSSALPFVDSPLGLVTTAAWLWGRASAGLQAFPTASCRLVLQRRQAWASGSLVTGGRRVMVWPAGRFALVCCGCCRCCWR